MMRLCYDHTLSESFNHVADGTASGHRPSRWGLPDSIGLPEDSLKPIYIRSVTLSVRMDYVCAARYHALDHAAH